MKWYTQKCLSFTHNSFLRKVCITDWVEIIVCNIRKCTLVARLETLLFSDVLVSQFHIVSTAFRMLEQVSIPKTPQVPKHSCLVVLSTPQSPLHQPLSDLPLFQQSALPWVTSSVECLANTKGIAVTSSKSATVLGSAAGAPPPPLLVAPSVHTGAGAGAGVCIVTCMTLSKKWDRNKFLQDVIFWWWSGWLKPYCMRHCLWIPQITMQTASLLRSVIGIESSLCTNASNWEPCSRITSSSELLVTETRHH